jgi:phospholipase/lecithinase/hemolysin
LSPNWNSVWDGAQARSYGSSGKKIAVLMTDGEYNQQYSGSSSTTQAREICTRMKAAGLIVYTVGFQLNQTGDAIETMRQCATDETHFFNSTTGEELRQSFREIALQISTLRISK